jgi:hypothetical protein
MASIVVIPKRGDSVSKLIKKKKSGLFIYEKERKEEAGEKRNTFYVGTGMSGSGLSLSEQKKT